jgi:hypothetical protein
MTADRPLIRSLERSDAIYVWCQGAAFAPGTACLREGDRALIVLHDRRTFTGVVRRKSEEAIVLRFVDGKSLWFASEEVRSSCLLMQKGGEQERSRIVSGVRLPARAPSPNCRDRRGRSAEVGMNSRSNLPRMGSTHHSSSTPAVRASMRRKMRRHWSGVSLRIAMLLTNSK